MIANAQERVLQADTATFPRYKTHAFLPTRTLHYESFQTLTANYLIIKYLVAQLIY